MMKKIKNKFKTIDYNDYTYRDIDTEENLEIVNDRISTTKRIANEKPESSSSSKRTSYETNSISNLNLGGGCAD